MAKKKNYLQFILILILLIVGTIYLLSNNPSPVFYDRFGLVTFAFLTGIGIWMLRTKKELKDFYAFIILTIGILGLIVDGYIVFGGVK